MSAERRWLDRGEIIELFRSEGQPWRDEVREHQARQDATADKLIDGATAAIYTATILTGDPSLGIKGALPEIRERLEALETRVSTSEKRFDVIERNQRRILRSIRDWALKDDQGKYSYPKIVAAIGGAAAVGQQLSSHAGALVVWMKRFLWVSGKY